LRIHAESRELSQHQPNGVAPLGDYRHLRLT
jgi:hypothetical protein